MSFNKHETDVLNLLQEHSNFYTRLVREQVLKAFASKLSHLPLEAIKKGLRELEASADKDFPSLQSIRSASSRFMVPENDGPDGDEIVAKKVIFEKLKSQFVEKFGQEALTKYTRAWVKNCFGKNTLEVIAGYKIQDVKVFIDLPSLDESVFEWPALLDLRDSNLDPKRAIELGKQRNMEAIAC
jgi:hypothetical protein